MHLHLRFRLALALSTFVIVSSQAAAQGLNVAAPAGADGPSTGPGVTTPANGATAGSATTVIRNQPTGRASAAEAGAGQAAQRAPKPSTLGPRDEAKNSADGTRQAAPTTPPTEFQRFVLSATGRQVEVFGSAYFSDNAEASTETSFPTADKTAVPSDYVIGPGDEMTIRAWGNVDIDYRTVVDRAGQISIPRVGTVSVAGLKAGEIENHLRTQIARVFKGFSLSVSLGQLHGIQIFVVGQARKPGSYVVSGLSTLVSAVFDSGGPGPIGSMRRIQLKRGKALVTELDLYDFVVRGDKSKDARLVAGDVIVFLPAGPRVALVGATDNPAIYELAGSNETLRDLLAYSGGAKATTNTSTAQLERIDSRQPKAPRTVQVVQPSAAAQTALQDGDVVTMFGVGPQFSNAVTLRGNVAAPLRYPYAAGMRVSDLIPERGALITPDYFLRKNKLVQFLAPAAVGVDRLVNDVRNIVDEPNWEYATIERLNPDRVTLQLIPFNLARAVIDRDPAQDLVLQQGDVITIFARNDIRGPVSRTTRLVRLEGEVGTPGIYALKSGDTLRSVLNAAGGLTREAYVYGTEFTRLATRRAQTIALDDAIRRMESTVTSQSAQAAANITTSDTQVAVLQAAARREQQQAQLTRLKTMRPNGRIALELSRTAAAITDLPDIELEDGDTLVVPNRPAFVNIVGAVANENAILWRDGRTVEGYVKLAGMLPDADDGNIFVINADGTVVQAASLGRFSSLSGLELMPGSTVVVPEKINRETFWTTFVRGLKDWTQILYQFGLSAAAYKTIR